MNNLKGDLQPMRKTSKGSRFLSLLLVMAMVMTFLPISAFAAVGDLSNVSTGLTGDIDTADTISLPIKIYDYEADGMLFEYAEARAYVDGINNYHQDSDGNYDDANKTALEFGATWAEDYAIRTSVGGSVNTGNYWSDVSLALKTGTYANYTRMTWAGNTTANWTGNRAGVVMADFSTSSTYTTDQVRYMVVVFRSNVRSGNFTVGINCSGTNGAGNDGNYTGNMAVTTENDTYWTYAVLDLKNGSLGSNWSTRGSVYGIYVGLPIDASGEWMDLAHVAFFSDEDAATAFGEYALTDGSERGDNRAFGLLRSSRKQYTGDNYASIIDKTSTVAQLNSYGSSVSSIDFSTITTLGYTLLGTFADNGIANVGLLESGLSAEGYPVYKEEVVTYLAGLLKHSLEITERTSDGWKNYRYVQGTASSVYGGTDLATALRTRINGTTGSYAAASAKDLVGTWAEVGGNIASYYDAAYFLLNSIFYSGSYNVEQDDYNYLVLSAGTDSTTGDKVYVFDGGFSTSSTPASASMAIDYNTTNGTIQNTSAAGKSHFVYEGTSTTTLNPFLPVTDRNTASGMTITPYYQDDGVINGVKKQTTKDTLYQRNFGFAMVSEGEFVYHADDELFFEFEGDDDVYLFINGELVMDIGSAHSIDGVRFNLNDYVNAAKAGTLGSTTRNEALALEEGNTYSFKFYYMERHSYGSNIRISTNIRVTDPSMVTEKTAWQDGTQLDFGSIVDKDKVVEYGFAITNNGEENLYNLTFTDNDIGVTLDPTNGLTVTGSRVYDVNGNTLEATDLTAVVSTPGSADIAITFDDNDGLKDFLRDFTAQEATEDGAGLFIGATLTIRGIGYKLSDAQITAGVFDNTVLTTATNHTGSKTLQGQASMRVYVPADPMYYQWAGHALSITKAELINDVMGAISDSDNPLYDPNSKLTAGNVNKIELVTKAGTAISSPYVTIDSSCNLSVNYDTTGSKVFYVKITYNTSNTIIIPVLFNVTDVQDSVYVLDYGLKVELTENGELTKNDTLTVPGRTTTSSLLGIGSSGAYSPNEITFAVDSDGTVEATYGDFKLNGQTLTFTPDAFLEGYSTTQVAVNVYESDITPSKITGTLDINNEVEMYKSVITLPANVVYYEDDFPAITYNTANTITRVGTGSSELSQSADQSEQYGHDDAYANAAEDAYSGDSLTKITINAYNTAASFTFRGTGFELIGRTNATDSASLVVKVLDSTGTAVKTIPVITEFDNSDDGGTEGIYQVPVIRVDDLAVGTYTVQISGVPAGIYDENGNRTGTKETYLYIDGLRIFQPIEGLTDENDVSLEENYLETEQDAQFIELRDQIVQGKVAVVSVTDTDGLTVSTATSTWTENLSGESKEVLDFNQVDSVEDYLMQGPNNEVYMTGTYDNAALVFYVKETGNAAHSLQIALRAIDETMFMSGIESGAKATVRVGVYTTNNIYAWADVVTKHTSSTEQYFVIDYTQCYYDTDKGAYQVVIRVDEGMVSYSSLKLTGLELVSVEGDSTDLRYVNGILSTYLETEDTTEAENLSTASARETGVTLSLLANRASSATYTLSSLTDTAEDTSTGDTAADDTVTGTYIAVDASTYVNFQSVKEQMASTVLVSDLEEPEVTEPEATEPEATDPDATEPEEETQDPGADKKPGDNHGPNNPSQDHRKDFLNDLISFLKKFWGL